MAALCLFAVCVFVVVCSAQNDTTTGSTTGFGTTSSSAGVASTTAPATTVAPATTLATVAASTTTTTTAAAAATTATPSAQTSLAATPASAVLTTPLNLFGDKTTTIDLTLFCPDGKPRPTCNDKTACQSVHCVDVASDCSLDACNNCVPVFTDPFGHPAVCLIIYGTMMPFGGSVTGSVNASDAAYYLFDITDATVENFDVKLTTSAELVLMVRKQDYPSPATASFASTPSNSSTSKSYTFHWYSDIGPRLVRPVGGFWYVAVKNLGDTEAQFTLSTTATALPVSAASLVAPCVALPSLLLALMHAL